MNIKVNTNFPEDRGTQILRNHGNYLPVDKNGK